jgi:predicted transcriptional regulator
MKPIEYRVYPGMTCFYCISFGDSFMRGSSKPTVLMAKSSLQFNNEAEKKQEKRDKLDLMLELLIASSEPVKKTHLLYRTKINHAQLSRYLELLLSLGMLEEISKPIDGYLITEKGRITLQLFTRARDLEELEVTKKHSPEKLVYNSGLTGGY